jgi:hypothetical protein
VAGAHLGVAVGADDEHGGLAGRAGDVAQEVERGPVGPVEVVDDERQRGRAAMPSSSADTASKSR